MGRTHGEPKGWRGLTSDGAGEVDSSQVFSGWGSQASPSPRPVFFQWYFTTYYLFKHTHTQYKHSLTPPAAP